MQMLRMGVLPLHLHLRNHWFFVDANADGECEQTISSLRRSTGISERYSIQQFVAAQLLCFTSMILALVPDKILKKN